MDGDALTYSWSLITVPSGSAAALTSQNTSNPTFAIDVFGTYVAQLIVNDGTVDSAPDTVTITTLNSAPVANAGPDQSGFVGDTITLNGTNSSDVDGDALTYSWSLITVPSGSAAALTSQNTSNPTFAIDVFGTYVAQLIVNDGTVDSAPDTVTITTVNSAPVANAGPDQSKFVTETVTLDGSASSDVDGDVLTYQWSITSKPGGSIATLSSATSVNPTFTIDTAGIYVAQLIVNDGTVDSSPDAVTITTLNSVPVANAGPDQSGFVGDTITLNGTNSSDVDGDALTYSWSLITVPSGSAASLLSQNTSNPTFDIDVSGTYVAQLIVNDSTVDSVPDTVTITTLNSAPVANAGSDQSVFVGDTVMLDGMGSSDVDGDTLSYTWSLIAKPGSSTAVLTNPNGVSPSFDIDTAGAYVAQLIVNDGTVDSIPDTVSISTINVMPIADAGLDQSVFVNDTVFLDGTTSWDPDGDAITFSWSFASKPVGSAATLNNTSSATPNFVVDIAGTYVLSLIVNDGVLNSNTDNITISTINVTPIAEAGNDQSVTVGDIVTLDATGSSDPDGDQLTYSWAFTSLPTGSSATLANPVSLNPTFIPDIAGIYVVSLTVNDGTVDSLPDIVTVTAVTQITQTIDVTQTTITTINTIDPALFNNPNNQNVLTSKLNVIITDLENGDLQDALKKLQKDLLKKTDGCAANGSPDNNDWIEDCDAQAQVYQLILDAIALIEELLQ